MKSLFSKIYFSRGIIYIKDFTSQHLPQVNPGIEVEIQRVTKSQVLDSDFQNKYDFLNQELLSAKVTDDNTWIFVALKENQIVHLSSVDLRNPSRLMIYSCLTLKQYRGNRIGPAVLVFIMKALKDRGYSRVFIATASWNRSSQKMIRRAGFKVERRYADIFIQSNPAWLTRLKSFLRKTPFRKLIGTGAYWLTILFVDNHRAKPH